MKLLILADGNSIHTQKWINGLLGRGIKIYLFSLNSFNEEDYTKSENFKYSVLDMGVKKSQGGGWGKIRYLKALPIIKKIISECQPDIIHAHFASSYGLLGALCGEGPLIVSVWGYDVFEFPELSIIHKSLLKFLLKKADRVLSTSEIMARRTAQFTDKEICVTPFGVDLSVFYPRNDKSRKKELTSFNDNDFVIGTVKLLEKKYGIDIMLYAFSLLIKKYNEIPLKCCIVGNGSEDRNLKNLAKSLGIEKEVYFSGRVPNREVPELLNCFDIYVALSVEDGESFGVAIIEASACAVPVIVTDAGGLPEVVEHNKTGIVVKKKNVEEAFKAMEKLVLDPGLRQEYGQNGLNRVKKLYDWDNCLKQMQEIYQDLMDIKTK